MRCKTFLAALLVLAFQAQAAHVSESEAAGAASVWAGAGKALGVRLGTNVESVREHAVTNGYSFYAVKLDGGTVIMTSDTDLEPVIAFSSSGDIDLSEGSPLLDLLRRDVASRAALAGAFESASGSATAVSTRGKLTATASSSTSGSASSASAATVPRPGASLWGKLLSASQQASSSSTTPSKRLLASSAKPVASVSDVRVAPLVQSKWSQYTVDDEPCYNYYTPNNMYCGCSATAAAQIMRYFKFPTAAVQPQEFECKVDNVTTTLSIQGGIYDWDSMTLDPQSAATLGQLTEENRKAIGKLTSDAGIALKSEYGEYGTNADPDLLASALRDTFGYADAVCYWNDEEFKAGANNNNPDAFGLHDHALRERVVLANLDARQPVQFSIYGYAAGHVGNDYYWAGHSVVADGYGYQTVEGVETEFVHINMGWGGIDDVWYNIPEIDAANTGAHAADKGYTFLYLGGATFNISAEGDAGLSILSGRITDDGVAEPDAHVSVFDDTGVKVAETVSDENGIYFFKLPGDAEYLVKAVSNDGKKIGLKDGIYLQATKGADSSYCVDSRDDVGNSWGNDIDIVIPHIRVIDGSETNLYPNLNTALGAASEMESPIVEIFGPTKLKATVTITTTITIRTVPGPSADYPDPTFDDCAITVDDGAVVDAGWALQVADGVRVAFSNVVFTVESGELPYIDVMETGSLSVAGKIGIGTVKVQDTDGFVVAGAFESVGAGLAVSYAGATERFTTFGTYECAKDDASSCAGFIVDALDRTLVGSVGTNPGALIWDRVKINPSIAIAYATNDAIGTTYYSSLDLAFKDYADGAEVVLLKDCDASAFTVPVTISNAVTIASADGSTFAVTATKDAGFSVTNGAELVFTNVVFTRSGSRTQNFVTLNDGSFVLDDGAVIEGLRLAGTAGAVYVNKGSVTMRDGSAITNCVATSEKCYGAAVYLKCDGCSMHFQGGTITGCQAGHGSGAAVYAGTGAKIDVSGSASAYGNFAGINQPKSSDVYFYQSSAFTLVGPLAGSSGIGVNCGNGYKEKRPFATIGDGVSEDAAKMACGHFFNNKNSALTAAVSGDDLVWAKQQTGPQPVPEADAVARLVMGGASDTYASIDDALEMAGGADARIELLKDTSLVKSLSIKGSVVLDGMGKTLTRDGSFYLAVTNSTLTLTNLVMDGSMGLGRILDVRNGSLVLEADTVISDVFGDDSSMVAPVVVWGGSFVMNSGVEIYDCVNLYEPEEPAGSLTAGAVLVQGTGVVAEFRGGIVKNCFAARAGGVYIGNGAKIRIGGDTKILGNKLLTGEDCNLVVQDKSGLVLTDILTSRVGYTEGVSANTNVFGIVDADFAASTTASNLVVSARRFMNDRTDARGMVATNETEAILVWSTAVGDSTEFTNSVDGVTTVYDVVLVAVDDDDPEIVECKPFEFVALEEVTEGAWKLTLKPGTEHCVYTLMTSDDLESWSPVGAKKTLSVEDMNDNLEFIFETTPNPGIKRFWKVEGANGIK